jgi:FkbM family methyltransferase
MNKYSQYGEEIFLLDFFKECKGLLIEIGAADGINNSNSRRLIEEGWSAILVEPNPNNFNKLKMLYDNNQNVRLGNFGCSSETTVKPFYVDNNDHYQQLSSFSTDHVDKCKSIYNCSFDTHEIQLMKTSEFFDKFDVKEINFLSIDTEGYDYEVISGIDFNSVNIELICLEDTKGVELLNGFGYRIIHQTIGNVFLKK